MADIKFMLPDSFPLIPAQSVHSALPANTGRSTAAQPDTTFQARVISQQQTAAGYLTEVQAEQRLLKLISPLPLPKGAQLTLQSSNSHPPQLTVSAIQMPATAQMLPASVAQLVAARIPFLGNQPSAAEPSLYNAGFVPVANGNSRSAPAHPPAKLHSLLASSINPLLATARPTGTPATTTGDNESFFPASDTTSSAPAPATPAQTAPARQFSAIPGAVQQILQQWLEQLPSQTQLRSTEGVRQSLTNSGLNYEQRLFALAEQIRAGTLQPDSKPEPRPADSQPAKPLMNAADGASTRQQNGPSETLNNLFTFLWKQATTALPAKEQSTAPHSLKEALQQAAARLNSAAASAAQPHQAQLSGLLGKDSKAVLSRAIIQWQTLLQPAETPAVKEIPLNIRLSDMPEGLRQLHTALARIEHEQVQRLQQGADQPVTVPLLFRDGQQLREIPLTLQQSSPEATKQQNKRSSWLLRLHFDLQRLGPLDIELDIALPRLSATFWSEQSHTLSELNSALQPLKERLQAMGVEVDKLKTRRGELPATQHNQIRQRLIDTHS